MLFIEKRFWAANAVCLKSYSINSLETLKAFLEK